VAAFVDDLESHVTDIDALKDKRKDSWGAEIFGNKTYKVFKSIRGLAGKLGQYKNLRQEKPSKALKEIKVFRLSPRDVAQWEKSRTQATADLKERKKKMREKQRLKSTKFRKMAQELASLRKLERKQKQTIKRLQAKKKPKRKS